MKTKDNLIAQLWNSHKTKLTIALALVMLLFFLNLILGSVNIPLKAIVKIIIGSDNDNLIWQNIILRSRLPQALVALGAGLGLGIAGLLMQTLFQNPLAGPSVLGISSGASLGVGFVILVAGQFFGFTFSSFGIFGDLSLLLAAIAGSLSILLIILFVSRKIGGTLAVLIIGVMIGYLSNSVVGIMKFYSLEEDVHTYVIWGLGSFSRLSLGKAQLFLLLISIPSIACLFISKSLNLLSLGDNYAQNLGLKINRARMVVILMSGLLTSLITAFCGPIVFIGMAVPHMAKLISRTSNHFVLIANAGILGAATALLCSIIARLPGLDSALPINSVTAFIGAPVVISVIWKRRKDRIIE